MTSKNVKVAIVTGASSGIGRETALRLLADGYAVYAGARRVDAMRELGERGARVSALDVTKGESVESFVARVLAETGRVDVLVNSAGYGSFGAVEDVPLEAAREQMEVNLFGLAGMVKAVLPTMRAQRSGRIVNVSSIGGEVWSPLGAWYHASKFALEGLSDCLRNELRPFGIQVVVVQPGGTKTEWADIAVENLKKASGAGPYRAIADTFAMLSANAPKALFVHPRVIADVIARAASARRPRARYVAPFSSRIMVGLHWLLSDRAFDWLSSKMFRLPKTLGQAGA